MLNKEKINQYKVKDDQDGTRYVEAYQDGYRDGLKEKKGLSDKVVLFKNQCRVITINDRNEYQIIVPGYLYENLFGKM